MIWRLATLGLVAQSLSAQSALQFQYVYDDTGQLIKAIDSTGIVIEYVYDSVGNMLEVKRSTLVPGALTIFSFTPQDGGPLTTVTISGQGFSTTAALNLVKFNGVAATVLSATSNQLVVQVPVGALAGSISVSVGSATANSVTNFNALPIPVITSISPTGAVPGSTIANFQVTGANLTGAALSFEPSFSPAAIAIGTASVNPAGNSASLSLTISGSAAGQFVLVANNVFGTSTGFSGASNTLTVGQATQFVGPVFSLLDNATPVSPMPTQQEANSSAVSMRNAAFPVPASPTQQEIDGAQVSVRNAAFPIPPSPTTLEVNGPLFSMSNAAYPGSGTPTQREIDSQLVSALNDPSSSPSAVIRLMRFLRQQLVSGSVRGVVTRGRTSIFDGQDSDGDAIPDAIELIIGTNPFRADTDGDGFPDGLEIALGSDPLNPRSIPNVNSVGLVISVPLSVRNAGEVQPGGGEKNVK